MGRVISMSNHKGGVGKTTSTVNIGAGLANAGKKVLLIDLDPQANLTQSLGVKDPNQTIYEALREGKLEPQTIRKNLDLVASTLDLSGAEVDLGGEAGREFVLKELIDPIRKKYDYILIDCPPSLGLLTINALTASDEVFIPLQSEYLALQGLTKLMEVVSKIQKRLNKKLKVGGVFLTQFDGRKVLNKDVATSVGDHFKDKIFKTRIRENVSIAEAPSAGKDIFAYAPKSPGAVDYSKLCEEIIGR